LSSPVDQERATGKSPGPAGSKACATNPPRFMVPMRAKYDVVATHEPERRAPARRGVACPECADLEIGAPSTRFMVPMRARRRMRALPARLLIACSRQILHRTRHWAGRYKPIDFCKQKQIGEGAPP